MIIRKQDRLRYYDALKTASAGDTRPFIRFIAHCLEKMIDVYLWGALENLPEIDADSKPVLHPTGQGQFLLIINN